MSYSLYWRSSNRFSGDLLKDITGTLGLQNKSLNTIGSWWEQMDVVIAGEYPLVEELTELCHHGGYECDTYLVEDFLSAVQSGYVIDESDEVEAVIEAHNESAAAKQELLLALAHAVPADTLILTSALPTSVTQAASWVMNPGRVVGFGLISPVGAEGVVELAAGLQTNGDILERAKSFWRSINFEPVIVDDGPGLVRARIICCLINEAIGALMEGVATADDIDKAMRLGTNYPYGPLEWADIIGLDTVLGVMSGLFEEWGEDRYRPSPLLRRMVLAGRLGRKSGSGFFQYEG
jgi:3-hydroxybutyryl-CoA dehydrogenase